MRTLLAALLLTLSVWSAAARDTHVYLNNPSPELAPGESLTIRFSSPMYSADEGSKRPPAPVSLTPSIPHSFQWSSPVSGSIRFNARPATGATYTLSVAPGLSDKDGAPVQLDPTRLTAIHTPKAQLRRHSVHPQSTYEIGPNSQQKRHTNATPTILLSFNCEISPEHIIARANFISNKGESIPAKPSQAPFDYIRLTASQERPWNDVWPPTEDISAQEQNLAKLIEEDRTSELAEAAAKLQQAKGKIQVPRCNLFMAPASPLIPDRSWTLHLPSTLSDTHENHRLEKPAQIELGYVPELKVLDISFQRRPFAEVQTALTIHFSVAANLPQRDLKKSKARDEALAANQITQSEYQSAIDAERITLSVNDHPVAIPDTGPNGRQLAINFPKSVKAGDRVRISLPALKSTDGQTLPPRIIERVIPELMPRLILSGELVRQSPKQQKDIEILCAKIPRFKLTLHRIPVSNAWPAFELWNKIYPSTNVNNVWDENRMSQDAPRIALSRHKGGPVKTRVEPDQLGAQLVHEEIITPSYEGKETIVHRIPWAKLIGENATGMYLVTAEEFDPNRVVQTSLRSGVQQLVQRSDLSIQFLRSGPQWTNPYASLCIANSASSGNPLADVTCTLFNAERKRINSFTTGADGTALLDGKNVTFVHASQGSDTLIFQTRSSFDSGFEDDAPANESAEATKTSQRPAQTLLFTDRHVYRPGETAHAKLIARDVAPGKLTFPTPEKQNWILSGPRGQTVAHGEFQLSDRGSFHVDIPLPHTVGVYLLSLGKLGDHVLAQTALTVAEFEPDAFEITLRSPKIVTLPEPALIHTEARYLSGLPLAGANASLELTLQKYPFEPQSAPDHHFSDRWHDFRLTEKFSNPPTSLQETASLSDDGRAPISIQIPPPNSPGRQQATVSVEITDAENQTLSAEDRFVVDSSNFYLGFRCPNTWSHQAGKSFPISVIAVDVNEDSIVPPNPVSLTLQQILWKSTITKTPQGERVEHSYDLGPVHSLPVTVAKHSLQKGLLTVPKSDQSVDLSHLTPGEYLAKLSTEDAHQREVSARFSFSIHKLNETRTKPLEPEDEEDEGSFEVGDFRVKLIPDKPAYQSGDIAALTLSSPVHGTATICVGASPILKTISKTVRPGLNGIEIPIIESFAPGQSITATIVELLPPGAPPEHPPRSSSVSSQLIVRPLDERLSVAITNLPTDARPNTVLSPQILVEDSAGRPVENAEVTLYAVDEGVLRLTNYTTPNPSAALYPNHFSGLSLQSSRASIRTWDIWDVSQRFANKGYLVGGGGNDASDLRNNFESTPLWIPAGKTNGKGLFTATLKVPDNITSYRLMAVVHHSGHRFGKADKSLRVNKPLQINPGIPAFVNKGDSIDIRCSVQNTTSRPIPVELRFDPPNNATVEGERTASATLPPMSTTPFSFRTAFRETGNVELLWRVQSADGKEKDGLRLPLNVRSPLPARHQVIVQRITDQPLDALKSIDAELLEGEGQATVTLFRDPSGQLEGTIDALLQYPYGCAEQTMSRLFPWILASNFPISSLKIDARRQAIEAGINRISSMITPSGSISYWPRNEMDQPPMRLDRWVTAYVGLGLAIMRQDPDPIIANAAGNHLSDSVFESLKHFVSLPDDTKTNLSARCLAVCALALAGTPDNAANERLLARLEDLNEMDRAILAVAMHSANTATPETLETLLSPRPDIQPPTSFHSVVCRRAMRLFALSRCNIFADEQAPLFSEIIARSASLGSSTTQENVWALIAANSYLSTLNRNSTSTSLTWNASSAKSVETLSEQRPSIEHTLKWHGTKSRLKPTSIQRKGGGDLFASIKVTSFPLIPQPPQNNGFNLERSIQSIDGQPLEVGDIAAVSVTVTVLRNSAFVALECPLPSLLEPLQGFETRGNKDRMPTAQGASHVETHSDRILFFWNEMPPGKYLATAFARVKVSGDAAVPSARIEEMYQRKNFSETSASRLIIP